MAQVLFDEKSSSPLSTDFKITKQMTITAAGLIGDGRITFEMLTFKDVELNPEDCNGPGCNALITTTQAVLVHTAPRTCCNGESVALSPTRNWLILDAPEQSWVRARFTGSQALGSFTVQSEFSATPNVDDTMRGCCPVSTDLVITQAVDHPVGRADSPFRFTITALNSGPGAASGAKIHDPLPVGFIPQSITAAYSGGATGTQPTALQLAEGFSVGLFPAGGVVTLDIVGSVLTPMNMSNTVTISPPMGVREINDYNNTATTAIAITRSRAALSLSKVANASVQYVGSTVTYTLDFANNGPDRADGALLRDVIPPQLAGVTITSAFGGGALALTVPTAAELAAGWVITEFPAGSTGRLIITGTATAEGNLVNQATLRTPEAVEDLNQLDNTAIVISSVRPRGVDVWVTETTLLPAYATGDTVDYVVTFGNNGPFSADGAVLSNLLASPAQVVSVTFAGGAGSVVPSPTLAQLAAGWTITNLPVGGSGVIRLSKVATTSGVAFNSTSIAPPTGAVDVNPSNNTALVTTAVAGATVTNLRKWAPNGTLTNVLEGDHVVIWSDLLKCVGPNFEPLAFGDRLMLDNACAGPVPVGNSVPCCDLVPLAPISSLAAFDANGDPVAIVIGNPSRHIRYACAGGQNVLWDVTVSAGALPPGLVPQLPDSAVTPTLGYSLRGFSGTIIPPAVTTFYNATLSFHPVNQPATCVATIDVEYEVRRV